MSNREPRHYLDGLAESGFAFVDGKMMDAALGGVLAGEDWRRFAGSWNDLAVDAYLAAHGTYRRRRHAVFSLTNDGHATREAHRPHYQSKTYNTLQGGIERWFEPVESKVADSPILRGLLTFSAQTFRKLAPSVSCWAVEVHQFRIEASPGKAGFPTPEGVHRDGVDYVMVTLVNRNNIASGTTTIHGPDRELLGRFTLAQPLDSALVDDARVFHGVTPVVEIRTDEPAFRDVLVVTLTAMDRPHI